jgi:hypothetical protein
MRKGLVSGALAAIVAATVVPQVGAATRVSSRYAVSGIETALPTNNTSTFGGSALGSRGDVAFWKANVVHQSLAHCPFGSGTSCAITGGTFALTSAKGGTLAGSFVSGRVTPVSQATPCGKQVFGVTGSVAAKQGPATFAATLTHYRKSLFGKCVIYFATIKGSVQLT